MKTLGLSTPICLAPLGGGPGTPELAAAVSEAGGLGSLAAAYLSAEQITSSVHRVRTLTAKPFTINLFTPMPALKLSSEQIQKALNKTHRYRAELHLPDPVLQEPFHPDFDQQWQAVLRARPAVFSFVFGLVPAEVLKECRQEKIFTLGTATTLDEAEELQAAGVDAVVVQGLEAGGHRGIFSSDRNDPEVGTLELTRQCSSHLKIPVMAAGGLMTGQDIARALTAGAQAVMLGTAFLLCPEAGTSAPYQSALRGAHLKTRTTRAFSGRWARGLENRFMLEMQDDPSAILPFPAQNALTRDIRNQALRLNRAEFLSLWAGQGVAQIRSLPAGDLVRVLSTELESASA